MTDPVYRLNFDPAESVRVARTVGFDMERCELARNFLEEIRYQWWFHGDEATQTAAAYECALGSFVFVIYGEDADAIPADLQDWYWRNVAMMTDDSFVVEVT
jgi:hypothetical protein